MLQSDLQTSFTALTNEPDASRKLFIEEELKHGFLRSSKEMTDLQFRPIF